MKLVEMNCKNCGAPLTADHIVERLAMARCGHCHAVFALDRGPQAVGANSRPAIRPKVPLPGRMEIEDFGDTLEIRRRWYSVKYLGLLMFCIFWNGFMIVWHGIAIASGAWFMSLFGIIHTAVGLGVLYVTVAGFLNITTIRVGRGLIQISHGPVPWTGNHSITVDDVQQLYCIEKLTSSKNGTHVTYVVMIVKDNGVRETLLTGLEETDQALFVEQEIERHLQLDDSPVQGELAR